MNSKKCPGYKGKKPSRDQVVKKPIKQVSAVPSQASFRVLNGLPRGSTQLVDTPVYRCLSSQITRQLKSKEECEATLQMKIK